VEDSFLMLFDASCEDTALSLLPLGFWTWLTVGVRTVDPAAGRWSCGARHGLAAPEGSVAVLGRGS
jgi:hypothetical protein